MSGKKIFVVDDDPMMRMLVADHLAQNPKFKVQTFSTGEECLMSLGEQPDIIILDYELNSVVLNAKDGLAILQEIKKIDKDIVVIMLSSQSQYGKAIQTITMGALEYIAKGEDAFSHIDKILSTI